VAAQRHPRATVVSPRVWGIRTELNSCSIE
jgi:hypothetical protein